MSTPPLTTTAASSITSRTMPTKCADGMVQPVSFCFEICNDLIDIHMAPCGKSYQGSNYLAITQFFLERVSSIDKN